MRSAATRSRDSRRNRRLLAARSLPSGERSGRSFGERRRPLPVLLGEFAQFARVPPEFIRGVAQPRSFTQERLCASALFRMGRVSIHRAATS